QAVMNHVVADIDGGSKTDGIRTAMALDDNAVQAEKHAAIDLARIHLFTQHVEGALCENITNLGEEAAGDRLTQQRADLAGGAFGRLQRDIAGETFGHHDIHRALADIVTLNETAIIDGAEICLADQPSGLANLFLTLHLL